MPKKKLLGKTEPRLFTPPLRTLNRRTSLGYEVADFAEISGEPFLPWQRTAAIRALELNPDGSFRFRITLIVVARQNGKSHLKRTITNWRMFMFPRSRILGVAQEVGLARDQWNMSQDTINASPELAAELGNTRNVNGDETFWLTNGSRYKIGAANRRAGRGGSDDEVNIDELREQRNWDAWAALSKTTMARENSQIWCMSNAGDEESVVLNALRESALAGTDPSIGIFEWSAPEGCELDDWDAIRQANPGLGYMVSEAGIRTALATDPPNVFRTEVLCQKVDHLDGAIDPAAWDDCFDPSGTMDGLRNRLAACFDMAPDGAHCTLSFAGVLEDGRARVEIVKAWESSEQARAELGELRDRFKWQAFGWFPTGPAGALAPLIETWPEQEKLTGMRVAELCQGLADLVRARRILHGGDPLLNAHIGGANKLPSGDGWRFTRRGGGRAGHVDAAYAAAGAIDVALRMPPPKRARIRIIA